MNCTEVMEKLLDGEMDHPMVREHLRKCTNCMEMHETILETESVWEEEKQHKHAASVNVVHPVMKSIMEQEKSTGYFQSFYPKTKTLFLCLAIPFVLVIVLFQTNVFGNFGEWISTCMSDLSTAIQYFFTIVGNMF